MTPHTLNVLMISTQHGGGGAGRVCEMVATGLRNAGHNVDVIAAANLAHDSRCRSRSYWRLSALARRLAARGWAEIGELTSFAWPLLPEFRRADVVHLHNLHGDYLSLFALPLWGLLKPLVWTLHDHWPLTGNCATPQSCSRWRSACGNCPRLGEYPLTAVDRTRFYRRLKPQLFRAARARLVSPSRWLAERVRQVAPLARLPLTVIPNPVDTHVFTPHVDKPGLRRLIGLTPDRPTIALTGASWAAAAKGGREAVRALQLVEQGLPVAQLVVVGAQGQEILDQSKLGGRAIPFISDRSGLAAVYAAADICMFPSRAENYPLTVLESLACGTPVVAFDVGGVREQLGTDARGIVVADGAVDQMAAAVLDLLRSPERRRELGCAGRSCVESQMRVDRVAAQYVNEYERALYARGRRPAAPVTTRVLADATGGRTHQQVVETAR